MTGEVVTAWTQAKYYSSHDTWVKRTFIAFLFSFSLFYHRDEGDVIIHLVIIARTTARQRRCVAEVSEGGFGVEGGG
jgi:hypothetical protein